MIKCKLCKPRPPVEKEYGIHNQNDRTCWRPYPICICYAAQKKKPIPLQQVHFYLKVQAGIVIVEVSQKYSTQTYENPIDLEYLFVINKNATVTKMIVEIEKEEAQIEYEEGIKQGKTMAYSDQDEQMPEIKKVKIGSLPPNKNLKIIFEYAQPLEVFLNKYWKVALSPLIDPLYFKESYQFNYSAYCNSLSYKIRSYIQISEFEFNYKQDISVEIDNGSIITSYKSPTHKMISTAVKDYAKQDSAQTELKKLTLMLEDTPQNYKPNKQFILLFSTDDVNLPKAILSHTNNDAMMTQKYCATLTLIPKFNEASLDDAYQQYLDGMNVPIGQKVNRGNYLFLLDRSGSMSGSRIKKAKEALSLFLKSLPEDSFFNIVSFGSIYRTLWTESKEYSQTTLDEAIKFVDNLKADMGGTEIYKPLQEVVYNKKLIAKYKSLKMTQNVFLLTDGEVDAKPIIDLIQQNKSAEIRIYSLGIGSGCSQFLIKRTAEVGNGKFHIMSDSEDINAKVIDLLEDSLTSYLKAFTLETNANNVHTIVPAPDAIVCLKKNQELMMQVIFSIEQLQNDIEFSLSCYDPQEQKPIKYNITLNLEQSIQNEYFHKIAAHRFINYVEKSLMQQDNQINQVDYFEEQITVKDIINISVQHQILSTRTAFLCEVCDLEDQFKQQIRQKVFVNRPTYNEKSQNQQFGSNQFNQAISSCGRYLKCSSGGAMKKAQVRCAARPMSSTLNSQIPTNSSQLRKRADIQCKYSKYDDEDEEEDLKSLQMSMKKSSMVVLEKKKEQVSKTKNEIDDDEDEDEDEEEDQKPLQLVMEKPTMVVQKQMKKEQVQKAKNEIKIEQLEIVTSQQVKYQQLIQFAQADGSFNLQNSILDQLKISAFQKIYQLSQQLLLTVISLFYLDLFCKDSRSSWQLVYQKGMAFLLKNGINYREEKEKYIEQYKELFEN